MKVQNRAAEDRSVPDAQNPFDPPNAGQHAITSCNSSADLSIRIFRSRGSTASALSENKSNRLAHDWGFCCCCLLTKAEINLSTQHSPPGEAKSDCTQLSIHMNDIPPGSNAAIVARSVA